MTYNLDLATLQNGYEWAKARSKLNAMAYSLFLLIVTLCNPEMKNPNSAPKARSSISEKPKNLFLSLIGQLTEVIDVCKYHEVKEGRRTYAKLIENGLSAMKSWIMGDLSKSGQHVEAVAIQAALLTSPSLEAFIPTFFGAFIGIQLLGMDQSKYSDITELLVQSLTRMNTFCWARVLTDFLISCLERYVGKIDVKWSCATTSVEAARHLQLLANASGAVFPSGNNVGHFSTGGHHFSGGGSEGHFGGVAGTSEGTTTGIISM